MTDFLASDIVFPSDSNEPKLSLYSTAKLPDPVDWAFHDYYSTALEKAHMPLHSLVDVTKLEPNSLQLRAVLRGALELVTNDMEQNRDYSTSFSHKTDESWRWEDDLLYDSWAPSEPENNDDYDDLLEEDLAMFYHKNENTPVLITSPFPLPSPPPTTNDDDSECLPSYSEDSSSTAAESQQSNSTKWSGVMIKIKSWMKPAKKSSFYSEKHPFQKFLSRR